jgi:Gpi18-like mannosyltransferase
MKLRAILNNSKKTIFLLLLLFLCSRVLFVFYYFLFTQWVHHSALDLLFNVCHGNDCGYYRGIALNWYSECSKNVAFFPLLPILMRPIFSYFPIFELNIDPIIGVIIINQIFALCSVILIYQYTKKNYNRIIAFYSSFIFIFSTEQIYFFTAYTESLFIFLILIIMYCLDTKKYFISSIFAALLSATRANGAAAAIITFYSQYTNQKSNKNLSFYLRIIINLLIALSGLLFFCYTLYHSCGNALIFMHAQQEFGRQHISEIISGSFSNFLHYFFKSNNLDRIAFFLFILANIHFCVKKHWKEFRVLTIFMLPALMSMTTMAFARFIFALPPVYIYLAYIYNKLNARLRIASVVGLIALNALYFYLLIAHSSRVW